MKRPSFQEFAKWTIISALIALMTACGASKHVTQTVERTSVDTVYLNSKQYDSIYIFKEQDKDYHRGNPSSLTSNPSPDTVFIKDVSVEYRYKLLRDTIKVVQHDSIPYEVTITETKEIQRPLTWYDHLSRAILWLNIGFVILLFIRFIRKIKRP